MVAPHEGRWGPFAHWPHGLMPIHYFRCMVEAAVFAALAQSALIVGAILVWRFHRLTRPLYVGALMAFGAGAVISAVSTDLVAVAYDEAGAGPTALGVRIGGLGYFAIIAILERSGNRERPTGPVEEAAEEAVEGDGEVAGATPTEARNLFIGMIIDGVPESVAIGLTLHLAAIGVSVALVGSVFIAGLPEAIRVAAALLAGGYSLGRILARFSIVVVIGAVSGCSGTPCWWVPPATHRHHPVDRGRCPAGRRGQRDGADRDPGDPPLGRRAGGRGVRVLGCPHLGLGPGCCPFTTSTVGCGLLGEVLKYLMDLMRDRSPDRSG